MKILDRIDGGNLTVVKTWRSSSFLKGWLSSPCSSLSLQVLGFYTDLVLHLEECFDSLCSHRLFSTVVPYCGVFIGLWMLEFHLEVCEDQ
ncbi:hypothetical protein L6452_13248 [Arctium lappa]|uniref:Uncharacterized protein n=1 Tax=Arctium lappa TaxID=4217 RepID=A0ACB9CHP5_ARCLA|nr:hypothetical protein L6452_13248 [Arctium lappa]